MTCEEQRPVVSLTEEQASVILDGYLTLGDIKNYIEFNEEGLQGWDTGQTLHRIRTLVRGWDSTLSPPLRRSLERLASQDAPSEP